MIEFEMPMRTVNPLNNRQHWFVVSKRGQAEKLQAAAALSRFVPPEKTRWPFSITLTRVCKRRMDTDGLAASFKHVRDAIAKWLGVDDGDTSSVNFIYVQEIGKAFAVKVQIK